MSLGVCGGCGRFAHFGASCPFCGGAISKPIARKPGRRARNGLLAAAITAAACGGTTSPGDGGSEASTDAREDYNAQPPYGVVPYDSGPQDAGSDSKDATDEDSDCCALYGGAPPPPDGG
jgi:hypothetical protein